MADNLDYLHHREDVAAMAPVAEWYPAPVCTWCDKRPPRTGRKLCPACASDPQIMDGPVDFLKGGRNAGR